MISSTTRRCITESESRKDASRLRKISANSNFLSVIDSAPKLDWSAAGQEGWWLSRAPGWRHVDRWLLYAGCCDQVEVEWSADLCPLPTDESRSSGAACVG